MGDQDILVPSSKIDPLEFDVTITALLIGVGAEKYINIFRKRNIGQTTLIELSDEDLTKLGVDDEVIRKKILDEVKNLPIFQDADDNRIEGISLGLPDIINLLEESNQQLYRIYLSLLANNLAIKKNKTIPDCLLHEEKYASEIALATLNEISRLTSTMEISLHSQMKEYTNEKNTTITRKIIVGTVGGAVITTLAVLFLRSLKNL